MNIRQVEQVLRAFAKAALGSGEARRPSGWKWTSVREFAPVTGAGAKASECYEVSQTGDGPIRMQRRYEDGSTGPLIVCDYGKATQRVDESSEPWDLPPDMGMVHSAMYVMQRWMLEPVETIDLTKVTHAGGDRTLPDGQNAGRILEVLEWPVAQNAVAKFGFDARSGRLLRLRVRDTPSGAEATIDFGEYRSVGGITWPHRLEVRSTGGEYTDVPSNWELTP